MISICEAFVEEYDILFNLSKSKLMYFNEAHADLIIYLCSQPVNQLIAYDEISCHALNYVILRMTRYLVIKVVFQQSHWYTSVTLGNPLFPSRRSSGMIV